MSNVTLANTTASLTGKTVVTAEGTATVTGLHTFDRDPAAPFAVTASSAVVTNLNSDMVDGLHASDLTATAAPTGAIIMWGIPTTPPTGWLMCDGSAVSRTTYSNLFGVIGTFFGTGNGTTTFNLPDFRQRFPLGKAASGTGSTFASTGGSIDHTHTYTDVVNHTHGITDPGHTHNQFGDNVSITASGGDSALRSSGASATSSATTGISIGNPVGGVASGTTAANNPPFLAVSFVIKY